MGESDPADPDRSIACAVCITRADGRRDFGFPGPPQHRDNGARNPKLFTAVVSYGARVKLLLPGAI
jgi:hypothetical protein